MNCDILYQGFVKDFHKTLSNNSFLGLLIDGGGEKRAGLHFPSYWGWFVISQEHLHWSPTICSRIAHNDTLWYTCYLISLSKGWCIKKMICSFLKWSQHQDTILHLCNSKTCDAKDFTLQKNWTKCWIFGENLLALYVITSPSSITCLGSMFMPCPFIVYWISLMIVCLEASIPSTLATSMTWLEDVHSPTIPECNCQHIKEWITGRRTFSCHDTLQTIAFHQELFVTSTSPHILAYFDIDDCTLDSRQTLRQNILSVNASGLWAANLDNNSRQWSFQVTQAIISVLAVHIYAQTVPTRYNSDWLTSESAWCWFHNWTTYLWLDF